MWSVYIVAVHVFDACVEIVGSSDGELGPCAAEAGLPRKSVEVWLVFTLQRVILEKGLCKLFDNTPDYLPASWTEVQTKWEGKLEE